MSLHHPSSARPTARLIEDRGNGTSPFELVGKRKSKSNYRGKKVFLNSVLGFAWNEGILSAPENFEVEGQMAALIENGEKKVKRNLEKE